MTQLRATLKLYGAGGWQDTEDMAVGSRTRSAVREAIAHETGGFIWWGTRQALESTFVNTVEVPAAVMRKRSEPLYPIVPLFVDLHPGADSAAIRAALGSQTDAFLDCNGIVKIEFETATDFCRRVSRRYVRDALRGLPRSDGVNGVTVAFRALSEPSDEHDLTFDWRMLLDASSRRLKPEASAVMIDALAIARDAVHGALSSPRLLLDSDLPLPLAFLVGYEWRLTTRLRLAVRQRTGSTSTDIDADGQTSSPVSAVRQELAGSGPALVVCSCLDGFGDVADRYAARIGAREIITLHVAGMLPDRDLRALARSCADELRALSRRGVEKHLLMLGPGSLAVFAGVASNATGPVTVPFWNGADYATPLVVGVN